MSTCRDVIKSAYRRSGILAAGVNINSLQSEIGLERLKGMFANFVVGGMFGRLRDKYIDDDYTAEPGDRVYNGGGHVITIPDTVQCGGRTAPPGDRSVIVVVNPSDNTTHMWLYDRFYGGWLDMTVISLDAICPLTQTHDEHIKNLLAIELLGETDLPIPAVLARSEGRARLALAANYSNERNTVRQEFM